MQEQAIIHNREAELFKHYELKSWEMSPRIYKILAASAVVNIFLFFGLAKANFLTAKSCDTPFVSGVCSVLDTLYVGSELLNADGEFVSKDYDKTELSEDDEIIMVDMTGEYPPLTYPAGYFALANPDQFQTMNTDPNLAYTQPSDIPGFPTSPSSPTTDLLNVTPNLPPQNDNVVQGKMPSDPLGNITTTPSVPKNRKIPRNNSTKTNTLKNDSPKTLPNLDGNTTAEKEKNNQNINSEAVKEFEVNKKPFEDLGDSLNEKLAKQEVDLNQPFTVVLDGTITADGKLDPKKSRFVKSSGDEKMVNVAKETIEAVGNSGFLGYLKNYDVDRVNFTMIQDDKQVSIIIISDQKDANKANTTASGFNTLLSGLIFADDNGIKKLDERSKILIKNAKVTSNGKNFIFNFNIPKQDAQNLINSSLKERAVKKANQPNTKTEINNSNTNAQLGK
jgi:hypothetical protein